MREWFHFSQFRSCFLSCEGVKRDRQGYTLTQDDWLREEPGFSENAESSFKKKLIELGDQWIPISNIVSCSHDYSKIFEYFKEEKLRLQLFVNVVLSSHVKISSIFHFIPPIVLVNINLLFSRMGCMKAIVVCPSIS